ncbi:MAG: flavin reductase family protein [Candidatus Cloacimonetes bacterium]|nr:flavin reductase family protein [Candidatus Cloacimonadota bacterium]
MMKQIEMPKAYMKTRLPSKGVLIVSEKPDGNHNIMTAEWFMRTSIDPPMFAISVGHPRYTHDCLMDKRYFNLIFPGKEMNELMRLAGSKSGREIDKFTAGEIEYFPGKLRKLPVLKDALACFECEIISQIKSGDHTVFIGQVRYSWLNDEQELFYYE